uniref:Aba392 n=1 Tax=Pasteurella multocida TaxID=747 RepID=B5AN50_PASMD|nr:Aba392 [Pasteurella multocida]
MSLLFCRLSKRVLELANEHRLILLELGSRLFLSAEPVFTADFLQVAEKYLNRLGPYDSYRFPQSPNKALASFVILCQAKGSLLRSLQAHDQADRQTQDDSVGAGGMEYGIEIRDHDRHCENQQGLCARLLPRVLAHYHRNIRSSRNSIPSSRARHSTTCYARQQLRSAAEATCQSRKEPGRHPLLPYRSLGHAEGADRQGCRIVKVATYKAWGNTVKIERPGRLTTDIQGNGPDPVFADMGASLVDDANPVQDFAAHVPNMAGFHRR